MRMSWTWTIAIFALVLSGCASGPKLSESSVPTMAPDQGRIYFYRSQKLIGAAIQPSIMLGAQKVGDCEPGGVFFKDVPSGDYQASVSTEVTNKLTFSVAAGETKYVRCYVSIGFVVGHGNLELVSPIEAQGEMTDLSYTGGKP